MNETCILQTNLAVYSYTEDFEREVKNITSFPLSFSLVPLNYSFKTKLSYSNSNPHPDSTLLSERMTFSEKLQ